MNKVVATGKTIEEAVKRGLAELAVSEDKVTINVLEQPSKGFLGLIGAKDAKVELTLLPGQSPIPAASAPSLPQQNETSETREEATGGVSRQDSGNQAEEAYREAVRFVVDVAATMGLQVQVEVVPGKDADLLQISGPDLGQLIGRRGQTLDALQYLANIVANRYSDSYVRLILDAENFRERRKKTLEDLADRLASRVVRTRKEVMLEPMSPQERKIIHSRLQDHRQVNTFSKGEEPNRRVVITLK
ncbi:protein jag [Paenibacillus sp. HN-1]|uniref:RNA-binding cell elongation regulator Jag/EloR n=1 Tax=Paenibacillus TaxID=44249 RepID=UPI001CA8D2DA|nr:MULTISPECIES: RNA-binding cell elongation regulator Jag/EloR [Paenibacillus]MBY9082153.1 protein jag [Paenibacillus sp. CGMCC 1.18879]MBY9082651.1 protein jag [Paenibacillus sinensis]